VDRPFNARFYRPTVLVVTLSPVLAVPPASPAEAAAFFTALLTFQTDATDVHA
jgi:hypothetical protein